MTVVSSVSQSIGRLGLTACLLFSVLQATRAGLAEDYLRDIRPLLAGKCFDCHNPDKRKGDLDLERFKSLTSVNAEGEIWEKLLERVQAYEMPPPKAEGLSYEEFQKLTGFLRQLPAIAKTDCHQIASDRSANFYQGYVMSRRLNRAEYLNTMRDLFGGRIDFHLDRLLPADAGGGEGFDTTGSTLFTSSIHLEKYLAVAEQITRLVLPDQSRGQPPELRAARDLILFQQPGWFENPEPKARAVITAFARRAWRRPVTPMETDRLMQLFQRARHRGDGFSGSVRLALQAVLISPHFIFLAEPEPEKKGIQRLADIPLASRLSYFLWSSMPDAQLLALAEAGKLADTNVYRAQIQRMLKDPKADALGERFALQWLDLERLGGEVKPDPTRYPEFDPALAQAMKDEVVQFFNHLVREDRPLLDLIDCRYTFANQRLAQLYDLPGISGQELHRVELADYRRGGLLGMAAVHAATSYPLRTSPVLRGRWVIESLLGDKIPPPPPGVPTLNEQDARTGRLSLRKQLEQHRQNAECASCHDKMDPLGFGLENFDVLGRWRDQLGGQPVDTRGTLPSGETFDGPAGLKRVLLAQKHKFVRHLARKMTGFAFGRQLNGFDNCVIEEAMKALESQNWRATVLIEMIATSYPFQYRFYPKSTEPEF